MDTDQMSIGARIKLARMANGHQTTTSAATAHEYCVQKLDAHEAGTKKPGVKSLASYSMAFGVDMFWLATGMDHAHAFLERKL